jgi:hypothetical protein
MTSFQSDNCYSDECRGAKYSPHVSKLDDNASFNNLLPLQPQFSSQMVLP